MLQKITQNKTSVVYIILILFGFISIRLFENVLFYDPLLHYYKQQFQNLNFPELNTFKLALHYTLRYFLNSLLSIALLWVLFKDKSLVNFSLFLYIILFLLLSMSFFFVLYYYGNDQKMTLFYIRRFIIQPLFVLIFIPGFWYQKKAS